MLGRQLRGDEPVVQALDALRGEIEDRLAAIDDRTRLRKDLAVDLAALVRAREESQQAESRHRRIEAELAVVGAALRKSTQRMEAARRLLHAAEEVRAAIIAAVFNESLNSTWRELFIRLAPDEPFVPGFHLPETGRIDAELETQHRDATRQR
jgi:exonuclease SbcC